MPGVSGKMIRRRLDHYEADRQAPARQAAYKLVPTDISTMSRNLTNRFSSALSKSTAPQLLIVSERESTQLLPIHREEARASSALCRSQRRNYAQKIFEPILE